MTKEKKQYVILGVLGVVVLGVGAFQLTGMNKPSAAASSVDVGSSTANQSAVDPELNGLRSGNGTEVAANTEEADFNERLKEILKATTRKRDPFSPVDEEDFIKADEKKLPPRPPRGAQVNALNPLQGEVPLVPGGFDGSSLPSNIQPVPEYKLKGVLLGNQKLAVLENADGQQKLVPVGGSLDGDTVVSSIEKGKVTIQRKDQAKILGLEEEVQ
jgi:hypothetical protein